MAVPFLIPGCLSQDTRSDTVFLPANFSRDRKDLGMVETRFAMTWVRGHRFLTFFLYDVEISAVGNLGLK